MADDDKNIKQTTNADDVKSNKKQEESREMEELKNKVKELENNWKRALADYQNLQKRVSAERDDYQKYGTQILLLKFLDILDHLEGAAKHINDKGLDLVIKLFKDVLKSEGIEEMERLNQKFDPNFDECIEKREGNKDNIIIEIARKGYKIREKILRPAKVIVEVNKK